MNLNTIKMPQKERKKLKDSRKVLYFLRDGDCLCPTRTIKVLEKKYVQTVR